MICIELRRYLWNNSVSSWNCWMVIQVSCCQGRYFLFDFPLKQHQPVFWVYLCSYVINFSNQLFLQMSCAPGLFISRFWGARRHRQVYKLYVHGIWCMGQAFDSRDTWLWYIIISCSVSLASVCCFPVSALIFYCTFSKFMQ